MDGIAFARVCSNKAEWQGFSFNPGLRRLQDYQAFAPYAQYSGEKELSALHAERHALILENDAVLHTGFGEHVAVPEERTKKARRKRLDKIKLLVAFAIGLLLGWWL
ncbi:hypothetical protein D3C84_993580 [compost metagenome]